MAKQPKKQTSARVSAIAAKYMGDESPMTAEVQDAIGRAIRECGLPLNDRATLICTNKIEAALAPLIADMRTLAASCLGQDETKGDGFSVPPSE